ncbi:MAG: carboxylate--amine ligase [Peptoniphilus sp.]|nr:carboxylate--amine ligase [Peptoniphilus sp.]MDY3118353.1 carboxylate--amine ligase [Peptoniphilus sp.]
MDFISIILGTDNNAYGVARSLHEAYGIHSYAYGVKPLRFTRKSKIVDVEVHEGFDTDAGFLPIMDKIYDRFQKDGLPILLTSCSDGYTALIAKYKEHLKERFLFNYIDYDLQQKLENKEDFYAICENYGLDYPKTVIITEKNKDHLDPGLSYPVGLKANDSIAFVHLHFEGKKKFYKIENAEELKRVVDSIYAAGYKGDLIAQDFIPGNSSAMYVLNAYVDTRGEVTMMCLGKCLLDECLPYEIGNYNALLTVGDSALYNQYEAFLKAIDYRGFANFDLKYDVRDGKYKVFEINIRQGRSSYYMTAGGCNFMTYPVRDLIVGEAVPSHYHDKRGLWLFVDPSVLRKYGSEKDKDLIDTSLKEGFTFTQWYEKDRSLPRFLDYMRRRISTRKYYPHYEPQRQND